MANNTTAEIDLGYYNSKLRCKRILGDDKIVVRSKVELTEEYVTANNTTRYEDDYHKAMVGEGAKQVNIELDKTKDEQYRILTYTLLGKLVKSGEPVSISLVINYPLNIYNQQTKTAFENYIKTKDFIHVYLDKEQKTFHVQQCLVFPQTVPVAYVHPTLFKDRYRAILDIGGITAQGVVLDNFNMVKDTKFSELLGTLVLFNSVRKALNSEFSVNIQDFEMPYVIREGLVQHKDRSLALIDEVVMAHLTDIKRTMKLNNWNLDNTPILLTGGGSLLMQKQLQKVFPYSTLSEEPLWDNAKGLRKVSEAVYEKKLLY